MTTPARHSALSFGKGPWKPALALALVCALTMVATQLAQGQTFSVIHAFSGVDGYGPYGSLTRDAAGNLYGTTSESFTGFGTAFKLKRVHGSWVLNTLFTFNGSNGSYPWSGVTFGPDGALYGTTFLGGTVCSGYGCGLVYKLTPPPTACKTALCPWTETVLHQFGEANDGASPYLGNLVFDHAGNLYGTTIGGGSANLGTVYELTPSNGGWTEKVLYSFSGGSDGSGPASGVILDEAGNLYGTTTAGGGSGCGGSGCGTVYELTPAGPGWKETILYVFQGGTDGETPYSGLIFDQSGNLYGNTLMGGSAGGGTVFELSPAGGGWTFSLLYAFTPGLYGAGGPLGSLTMDGAGVLYGTTYSDGSNGAGSVFKLKPQNGGWSYSTLHDFTGGEDGLWPLGSVIVDAMGNIYGTTSEGGTQTCSFEVDCGLVWEITP